MPQDTAALATVGSSLPTMDPEKLVRELTELRTRLQELERRLDRDNDRLMGAIEAARDKAADDHEQACHRAGSAIEAARVASSECARLEDRIRGNGTPGIEARLHRVEDLVGGLVDERRREDRRQPQPVSWWHRIIPPLVVLGIASVGGGIGWLIIRAFPALFVGP
jgi:hypothetical protein